MSVIRPNLPLFLQDSMLLNSFGAAKHAPSLVSACWRWFRLPKLGQLHLAHQSPSWDRQVGAVIAGQFDTGWTAPKFPGTSHVILGLNSQLRDRWDGAGSWLLSMWLRWWSLWLWFGCSSLKSAYVWEWRMAPASGSGYIIWSNQRQLAVAKLRRAALFVSLKGAGSEVRRQWPVD